MARVASLTVLVLIALAGAPYPGRADGGAPVRIRDVRVGEHAGFERLVIELDRDTEVAWEAGPEPGEESFYIAASPMQSSRVIVTQLPHVGMVSVTQMRGGTRVSVEPRVRRVRAYLLSGPPRLVIDFAAPGVGEFVAPAGTRVIEQARSIGPLVVEPETAAKPPEPEPPESQAAREAEREAEAEWAAANKRAEEERAAEAERAKRAAPPELAEKPVPREPAQPAPTPERAGEPKPTPERAAEPKPTPERLAKPEPGPVAEPETRPAPAPSPRNGHERAAEAPPAVEPAPPSPPPVVPAPGAVTAEPAPAPVPAAEPAPAPPEAAATAEPQPAPPAPAEPESAATAEPQPAPPAPEAEPTPAPEREAEAAPSAPAPTPPSEEPTSQPGARGFPFLPALGALALAAALVGLGWALLRRRRGAAAGDEEEDEFTPVIAPFEIGDDEISPEELARAADRDSLLEKRLDEEVRARFQLEERLAHANEELKVLRDRLHRVEQRRRDEAL